MPLPTEDFDFNLSPEDREALKKVWTLPDDGHGNCVVTPNVEASARHLTPRQRYCLDIVMGLLDRMGNEHLANTFQSFTKPPHVSWLRRLWRWATM